MVSRYRDIIETNQASSLSRTGSMLNTALRNGSSADSTSVNGVSTASTRTLDADAQSIDGQSTTTEHTQYGREENDDCRETFSLSV